MKTTLLKEQEIRINIPKWITPQINRLPRRVILEEVIEPTCIDKGQYYSYSGSSGHTFWYNEERKPLDYFGVSITVWRVIT